MRLIPLIMKLLKMRHSLEPSEVSNGGPAVFVVMGDATFRVERAEFLIVQPWGEPMVRLHVKDN